MRKLLVTGGTVFVSRFVANYFAQKGNDVYVLNRNSKPQLPNVTLIDGDRNDLGDKLKGYEFDAVLDITAYTREHAENLVNALGTFGDYIMVSSSAVYPETNPQPFTEDQTCGPNIHWGAYGTNKLAAEEYLRQAVPHAYILRPPYLYGPMQNVYREPFVFECAEAGRKFYIPGDGNMNLQFFHVEDLCRFIEILLDKYPEQRIYNVGNPNAVTVNSLPESWGTGLGHAMLTEALKQIGDRPVYLWAFKENTRARRFYEKHGFLWDGTERVSEFDGAHEVRYVRE